MEYELKQSNKIIKQKFLELKEFYITKFKYNCFYYLKQVMIYTILNKETFNK